MGLFDFFKKDPQQLLDQAEQLLEQGDADRALRRAREALGADSLASASRAEQLVRRAREALADAALQKADRAEESGYLDDAAEWILSALENVTDESRRDELRARAAQLQEQAEKEEQAKMMVELAGSAARRGGPPTPADLDNQYEALIGMLDDDVADHYADRPVIFKRAYVWLNEGQAEEAWEAIEGLAAVDPGDPVLLLERGRCRLMLGEPEQARQDFESVWETFGDEPLDVAATISVPTLWAEAMLALDKPAELVERLEGVADPEEGDVSLCHRFAQALIAAGDEGSESYILRCLEHFPRDPEFPHMLAILLHGQGRPEDAIAGLEEQIRPACSGPNCSRQPLHIPSVRTLAGYCLEDDRNIERARELVELIAIRRGGLQSDDLLLLADYHERAGDPEAAEEARAEAERLREEGEALVGDQQQRPSLQTQRSALG